MTMTTKTTIVLFVISVATCPLLIFAGDDNSYSFKFQSVVAQVKDVPFSALERQLEEATKSGSAEDIKRALISMVASPSSNAVPAFRKYVDRAFEGGTLRREQVIALADPLNCLALRYDLISKSDGSTELLHYAAKRLSEEVKFAKQPDIKRLLTRAIDDALSNIKDPTKLPNTAGNPGLANLSPDMVRALEHQDAGDGAAELVVPSHSHSTLPRMSSLIYGSWNWKANESRYEMQIKYKNSTAAIAIFKPAYPDNIWIWDVDSRKWLGGYNLTKKVIIDPSKRTGVLSKLDVLILEDDEKLTMQVNVAVLEESLTFVKNGK